MKATLIVIGFILILGGANAARSPKPWTVFSGGSKHNSSFSHHKFSEKSSSYFGFAAIGLGVAAIVGGLAHKSESRPTAPLEDLKEEEL